MRSGSILTVVSLAVLTLLPLGPLSAQHGAVIPPPNALPSDHPYADIQFGKYHALVIGNNAYSHLPNLKTAVNDATDVARMLERDYGFAVKLLLDASRGDILRRLALLRADL